MIVFQVGREALKGSLRGPNSDMSQLLFSKDQLLQRSLTGEGHHQNESREGSGEAAVTISASDDGGPGEAGGLQQRGRGVSPALVPW